MNRLRGFLILLTVLLTVIVALLPLSAQAQCFPRTDWNSYTVVRGDTLTRIARRYGISTADLANANCLTNWSLIYRGQRLYVPPSGNVPIATTPPIVNPPSNSVTGSFQYYENGLMIWRSDNSDIWVLDNNGLASRYWAAFYGLLPDSFNVGATPSNRIRPILGFGRVWGNILDVRNRLGWATQAEMGATITPQVGNALLVTLAAGRGQLVINAGANSWSYLGGNPPTPPPAPTAQPQPITTTGSYQPFENGLMIWRSDNSDIWVLDNGGFAARYRAAFYGLLPDSFNVGPTPANRIRPILGFGRVWGNIVEVRNRLGWATQGEMGATITPQVGNALLVTLAAGRGQLVINAGANSWSYVTGTPIVPTEVPPLGTPIAPTPTLSSIPPQILSFNANPNTVQVGQNVTLNWDVQGVQAVQIDVNNAGTSAEPEVTFSFLPLSGTTLFTVPAEFRGIWFTIYGLNFGADGTAYSVISSTVFVAVNVPTTSTTVYAAYQPYDNGFMIWRSDNSDIYVFYNFGAVSTYPLSYYGAFPENPVTVPTPPGKVRPISGFGRVWGSQSFFMTQLGWATAPEQGYTMTIETLSDGRTRFTLPNGYTVTFGNGVWSA